MFASRALLLEAAGAEPEVEPGLSVLDVRAWPGIRVLFKAGAIANSVIETKENNITYIKHNSYDSFIFGSI